MAKPTRGDLSSAIRRSTEELSRFVHSRLVDLGEEGFIEEKNRDYAVEAFDISGAEGHGLVGLLGTVY